MKQKPEVVLELLIKHKEQYGCLDADAMHDIVADPKHPLHIECEWDDAIAGRRHRVDQLRALIRFHDARVTERLFAPVFVHDPIAPAATSRYIELRDVKVDTVGRQPLLVLEEVDRVLALLRRTLGIAESLKDSIPDGILARMQKAETQLNHVREALRPRGEKAAA